MLGDFDDSWYDPIFGDTMFLLQCLYCLLFRPSIPGIDPLAR